MPEAPPPAPPRMYDDRPAPPASNAAGLAGFIVSLVGLLACGGILSPVGLIISLVGLTRQPRGFAIAGVVLGIVGSIWCFILIFVIGVSAILLLVGLGIAAAVGAEMGKNAWTIAESVETYYEANGRAPESLTDLSNLSQNRLLDFWDNPYRYEAAENGMVFYLRSDGADGVQGTDDDLELRRSFTEENFTVKLGDEQIASGPWKVD